MAAELSLLPLSTPTASAAAAAVTTACVSGPVTRALVKSLALLSSSGRDAVAWCLDPPAPVDADLHMDYIHLAPRLPSRHIQRGFMRLWFHDIWSETRALEVRLLVGHVKVGSSFR